MNSRVATPPSGISPRMAFLSAAFHGLGLLAIILLSTSLFNKPEPVKLKPIRATIVSPVPEKALEPMTLPETAAPEPKQREPVQANVPRMEKPPSQERETIRSVTAKPPKQKNIQLNRRPKGPDRVPEPIKQKPKKPPQKKRENNEKYLASVMEKLRKGQQTRQKSTPQAPISGMQQERGAIMDAEALRWLEEVKDLINANWSVLRENRGLGRETRIGVDIAEDGSLKDATVDGSSGDAFLDQSAMRAVYQAAPFPPVPQRLMNRIRKAGGLAFRFTTTGVR